ncbi:MAG: SpoIIE family protein phosphatase [Polyangiaceae bacterium]|nr:SpoIIE family protein phosphatase [Polyangiaceae bacterium]
MPPTKPPSASETVMSQRELDAQPTRGVLTLTTGAETGRVISIEDRGVTLGRSEECSVCLPDLSLSRVHARVRRTEGGYFLEDLKSRNGCFVNEARVDFAAALENGDRVRLGDTVTLRFFLVDDREEAAMRAAFEASRRDALATRLKQLTERDETLRDELVAAGEFQRRALVRPPAMNGVAIDVLYRPLDGVGGDLFHVSPLSESVTRVFLADATGHGIRASLSMMLILSEYESAREATGPAAVLASLNDRFTSVHAHLGVRFTGVCVDLDRARGSLRVATAAHPSLWLLGAAGRAELPSGGPFVGLLPGMSFPEVEHPLAPRDRLVAYTDGLTEAFDPSGEAFGESRLLDALTGVELGLAVRAVEKAVDNFRGARALDDDATLLVIDRTG